MKMKTILTIAMAVLTVTATVTAQDRWSDRFRYDREGTDLYPDHEMTIDLFAAYTDAKAKFNDTLDTSIRGGDWGGGAGLNYFFTRNVGLGVDAFAQDNGEELVDAASASVILRLPVDVLHLAPYVFGGGGHNFQGSDSWTAHAGVGLELRLNSHTGIFVDGRHVFMERKSVSDYALIRSGLRFAF
jgi:hypothetical protein